MVAPGLKPSSPSIFFNQRPSIFQTCFCYHSQRVFKVLMTSVLAHSQATSAAGMTITTLSNFDFKETRLDQCCLRKRYYSLESVA